MMQHEMRPAMHEEHVLGVEIDVGLQHGIIHRHAEQETRDAPARRTLAGG